MWSIVYKKKYKLKVCKYNNNNNNNNSVAYSILKCTFTHQKHANKITILTTIIITITTTTVIACLIVSYACLKYTAAISF